MTTRPTVSVTIPTYNRAELLRRALDSVFQQTYQPLEVIVIDDGSTDHTATVVADYGGRVRYFHQPNGGLGVARNAGLRHATGELIAFLDSDDLWLPFKIELQVKLLGALPEMAFLFSEFVILKDDGRRISNGSRTWLSRPVEWSKVYERALDARSLAVDVAGVRPGFSVYCGGLYKTLLDEALVLPTTAIVRRDAIGDLRFTEHMTIFEDWEFFARLARDHEGAFMDVETALNRGHDSPDRLTKCGSLAKAECYLEMFDRVWRADAGFRLEHGEQLRETESQAALAIAREALMQARGDVVESALRRWRAVPGQSGRYRALTYRMLAAMPGGRNLMRGGALGMSLANNLMRSRASHPVNPAA